MSLLLSSKVPKRNKHCALKKELFSAGAEIYSSLLLKENVIIRCDFCSTCWEQMTDQEKVPFQQAFWKTTVACKRVDVDLPRSDKYQKALDLLADLIQNFPEKEAEIFILSLFLSHAKKIILKKEFYENAQLYFFYQQVGGEEIYFTVKFMDLSQDKVDQIRNFLAIELSWKF